MSEKNKTKQNIFLTTLLIIIVGFLGIMSSAYFAESTSPQIASLASAFATGLTTISVALIGFAIFSLALDTKNWRDYFSDRLKEIVIEQDYLKGLDEDTLKTLQTSVLKAQFKNPGIDKEGGFLNYFNRNVHKYISEPYREDVSAEVLMELSQSGNFIVKDKVIYICRSSGGKIQSDIGLKADEGEFESVNFIKITVQHPQDHESPGEKKELYNGKDVSLHEELIKGFRVPLNGYEKTDGLIVIIEQEYEVKPWKFQYWQMAHPTRNFDITITYPKNTDIQFKTLVLEDVVSQVTQHDGYLKLKYDSWLLPKSGLAWLINKNA